jgi:hypothetical protein
VFKVGEAWTRFGTFFDFRAFVDRIGDGLLDRRR